MRGTCVSVRGIRTYPAADVGLHGGTLSKTHWTLESLVVAVRARPERRLNLDNMRFGSGNHDALHDRGLAPRPGGSRGFAESRAIEQSGWTLRAGPPRTSSGGNLRSGSGDLDAIPGRRSASWPDDSRARLSPCLRRGLGKTIVSHGQ